MTQNEIIKRAMDLNGPDGREMFLTWLRAYQQDCTFMPTHPHCCPVAEFYRDQLMIERIEAVSALYDRIQLDTGLPGKLSIRVHDFCWEHQVMTAADNWQEQNGGLHQPILASTLLQLLQEVWRDI